MGPVQVVRAAAERVVGEIEVQAWVLDDTGFPKDGVRSPGVKRQYSGTLGKIGNCQVGVSVHAVDAKGTVPLGWALYLPEEWCEDPKRRAAAKIPEHVTFKTKPELGIELIERAAGWEIDAVPVLGDQAYSDDSKLRARLDEGGSSTCSRSAPALRCSRPRRSSRSPSARARRAARAVGCAPTASRSRSAS